MVYTTPNNVPIQYNAPNTQLEKIPNKITGPAIVKILHPIPKTCPSFWNSIAGAATELANPVIGTKLPAPPIFVIFWYKLNPVKRTDNKTKDKVVKDDAASSSNHHDI